MTHQEFCAWLQTYLQSGSLIAEDGKFILEQLSKIIFPPTAAINNLETIKFIYNNDYYMAQGSFSNVKIMYPNKYSSDGAGGFTCNL